VIPEFLPLAGAACAVALGVMRAVRMRPSVGDAAFIAGMAVLAVESGCAALTARSADPAAVMRYEAWRLTALALLPGIWMLFSTSFARGRLQRSRIFLAGTLVLPLAVALTARRNLMAGIYEFSDGPQRIIVLEWTGFVLYLWLLIGSVVVLMNLERTFRASVGMMRWRIKYMLLGIGLVFVVRLYTSSQALLFRGVDAAVEGVNTLALLLASPFIVLALVRGGRHETDVYPSQSILQSSITVLLAGVYLLVVGVFAKIVAYLGGGGAFALKAFLVLVALVGGAVLLQSDRARLRLRQFLSRNFHRPLFDYRKVWRTFTECTATRVEQTDLSRSMVKLIAQTFEALSISLWLMDDRKESLTLVASTFLPESDGASGTLAIAGQEPMLEYFSQHGEPLNLDTARQAWVVPLQSLHPRQFSHGGHRWVMPLIGQNNLLGLLILGDRVGGVPLDVQELDMLKCVGDHVSSSLLNIQLSQRLLEAKELEAFQTMATFFVHDLKNAASTLSLMLRNLPVHFDDPEFRQDALRGMSKTVTHINGLISRLSLLRHELKVSLAESDLNAVVQQAVDSLDPATRALCDLELGVLPPTPLDRDQFLKVLTNLLINAREAMENHTGRIRVTTAPGDGHAVLTVQDSGCGMSPEFLRSGLFRPFQTTKQKGLGIGMFQSKMIIEAHGGRIGVMSEHGKGTTFRIFLPLSKPSPPPLQPVEVRAHP
jgi:putative PEP-CTERM system histidine kinase